jgi:hypothetical protein
MTTRKRSRKQSAGVPWSREESERFVEDAWPNFASWINGNPPNDPRISDDWLDLRARLNQLAGYPEDWLQGAPPERGEPKLMSGAAVPAGHLVIRHGVLMLKLGGTAPGIYRVPRHTAMSNGEPVERLDGKRATLSEESLSTRWNLWMRLLMVLSAEPTLRNRVRACPHCGRYFMLPTARADRGKGYRAVFCSPEHSRSYTLARNRARQKAAYRDRAESRAASRNSRPNRR